MTIPLKFQKFYMRLQKFLKLKKQFTATKDKGHYDVNPYSYVPKKDIKLKIKIP